MKKRLLFILCFIVGAGSAAVAQQARTVTNADLEKFRQERVTAERDLRENYERLGFPSPEEMERRDQQRREDLAELSESLRQEELQRRALSIQARAIAAQLALAQESPAPYPGGGYFYGGSSGYVFPGGYYNGYPFYRSKPRPRGLYNRRFFPGGRRTLNSSPIGGGYAFPNPFSRPSGVRIITARPR